MAEEEEEEADHSVEARPNPLEQVASAAQAVTVGRYCQSLRVQFTRFASAPGAREVQEHPPAALAAALAPMAWQAQKGRIQHSRTS